MARKAPLLMERAYGEIKRRIITLGLAPGQRIDDHKLGREHALSRTPIREAVFRLAAEGLVEIRQNEGFFVRSLDLMDITHLFEAHLVLAKAVARLAAKRATPAEIDRMAGVGRDIRSAIDRRDYLAITSSNAELHRLEAAAAHSGYLQSMADRIYDQEQRLAYLCFGGAGHDQRASLNEHFQKVRRQHDDMLAALAARDGDGLREFEISGAELAAVSLHSRG